MILTGVGLTWLGTTGITSLTGSFSLQGRDYTRNADIFEARDSNGNVIGKNAYNFNEEGEFKYLNTSATINPSASVQMPQVFDQFVIADGAFAQIAGTWRVKSGVKAGNTNRDALIVTVPVERYVAYS